MAELDYAYLADYAAVQDGKLSTIGASFTFVRAQSLPITQALSVAGRVRARVEEGGVAITIKITPPDDSYQIEMSGVLDAGPDHTPYGDGKVGLLFALNTQMPLLAAGLYTIQIFINDEFARRLAFEAQLVTVS